MDNNNNLEKTDNNDYKKMEFRKHLFSSKYGLHSITPMKETTPSFWKKKGTLENLSLIHI